MVCDHQEYAIIGIKETDNIVKPCVI